MRQAKVASFLCGQDQSLLLICGPCVLVDDGTARRIADELARLRDELPINVIFKASFDKANRSSGDSYRGLGLERGLELLAQIRESTGLPVTTDVHLPEQVRPVAEVVDLLQIPAFLCRQTDLLLAAGASGKPVHVKKGQFLAPWDMPNVLQKLRSTGCDQILIGERGTFFGYGRLVNDMTGIAYLQALGVPVVFDATHSVQLPGSLGQATGGNREMVAPLSRAAIAVGVDGLFLETYPDPSKSPSDGPNMLALDAVGPLLRQLLRIRSAVMTGWLLMTLVLGSLSGCRREAQIATGEAEIEQRALAAMRRDHIERALGFLREYDRFQKDAALGRVLHHLRKWTEDQPPEVDWIADPMFGSLPPRLGVSASTGQLSRRTFRPEDVRMLRETIWLRDLAQRLSRTPQVEPALRAWLESETSKLEERARLELTSLATIFDWVVRNIQIEPTYLSAEERESQADDTLVDRPGVRRTAWEALLTGKGDALCRARLVLLLARQLEIPVFLLAEDMPREPPPWCLAALIGEQLYLFDPKIGLPLPCEGGKGIATLAQVLESPDLLRQWDLPGSEYAVGPKQLESIVALVDATPDYLSQRMRWLELALPPKDKTILTCQPTALRRKIERHPGIDRVAIWTQPYEVELLRTKIDQYPQLTNLLNRDLAPLNPPWPLAYARGQHIRGIFRDPDYQEGAKELYLKVRLSDAQIRQIRTPPGMQRLLESMLGETYAIPTEPAQFQSMMQATRELLVALRSYASLWLGQIAFETQDYDTAREFFQNRVLADESNKSWRWGATYCLARCQEALGRAQRDPDLIRQALATYRSDSDSPQASGNRLRAQQLEKWLAAESSLIRVNE